MSATSSIELTDTPAKSPPSKKDVKSKKKRKESVPMLRLFRFATPMERVLILIATICSAGSGALLPVSITVYGDFISNISTTLDDYNELLNLTYPVIYTMVYMGTAMLVASYISNCLWVITGENQTRRIRTLYLHAVLRQDMTWFDTSAEGSLNTRLASDTQIIQDGISERFGRFVMLVAQFIAGIVIAFVEGNRINKKNIYIILNVILQNIGWRLAVIMLAVIPLLFVVGGLMGNFMKKYTLASLSSYAQAGFIAEQAFNSIRTVYSFNLQKRFSNRYENELSNAFKIGIKRAAATGLGYACNISLILCIYAITLWYGAILVTRGQITGPIVFVVLLSMITGSFSLLMLPVNLTSVTAAQGAAYKIFATIDRVPDIDTDAKDGIILESVTGDIEFKNVVFKYPTRPDVTVLNGLSLKIKPGMTVAFVGPSGSGKSTTVQLVQRFYDPVSGSIYLDGHDLKSINVKSLRRNIGVVR